MQFQKGKLYVRIFNEQLESLFYPDEDVPEDYTSIPVRRIAYVKWGVAEPNFGIGIDLAKHGERSGAGNLIEFAEASVDYINQFFDLWSIDPNQSIANWVSELEYCKGLLPEEKDRITAFASSRI